MKLLNPNIITTENAYALISRNIDRNGFLRQGPIKERGWFSVILPGRLFGNQKLANAILAAVRTQGDDDLIALNLDLSDKYSVVGYQLEAVAADIYKFGIEQCFLGQLITRLDESFMIVLTTEDYFIAAGPRDFIEAVCENDVNSAVDKFTNFAMDSTNRPDEMRELMELKIRYTII